MTTNLLNQALQLPSGMVLPNRLAKSAMSEALATYDNHPTPELVELYRRWAASGIGMLITGNVMIDRRALGEPGNVVIEDETDEVTANGHVLRFRSIWDVNSIKKYIKDMRKQGTWAGEVEILAAHLLYPDINLFVLKKNKDQFYVSNDFYVGSKKTIRLYNQPLRGKDYHFQVFRDDRDSGRSNLKGNSRRRKPCVNTI
jgi:hypothetical protein